MQLMDEKCTNKKGQDAKISKVPCVYIHYFRYFGPSLFIFANKIFMKFPFVLISDNSY